MGEACDTYQREEECIQKFGRETWMKEAAWSIWA